MVDSGVQGCRCGLVTLYPKKGADWRLLSPGWSMCTEQASDPGHPDRQVSAPRSDPGTRRVSCYHLSSPTAPSLPGGCALSQQTDRPYYWPAGQRSRWVSSITSRRGHASPCVFYTRGQATRMWGDITSVRKEGSSV